MRGSVAARSATLSARFLLLHYIRRAGTNCRFSVVSRQVLGGFDARTRSGPDCGDYGGKANFSSLPNWKTGFLRLRISPGFSDKAVTRKGIAMVESQCTVTMLASWAIFPQLWASSNVQPERPPQ